MLVVLIKKQSEKYTETNSELSSNEEIQFIMD